MESPGIERRTIDQIKMWAAILGPVIGMAFGFGVSKATLTGTINQNTSRISKLEGRVDSIESVMTSRDGVNQVSLAKISEQVSALDRRTGRVEDLLQQTLYKVVTPKK